MQKIMFKDSEGYRMTDRVLSGNVTATTRNLMFKKPANVHIDLTNIKEIDIQKEDLNDHRYGTRYVAVMKTNSGEIYRAYTKYYVNESVAIAEAYGKHPETALNYENEPGYTNKYFVDPSRMPHILKIKSVELLRIKDIVEKRLYIAEGFDNEAKYLKYIRKTLGNGTVDYNAYVWRYEFTREA